MGLVHYLVLHMPLGWMLVVVVGGYMLGSVIVALLCHAFLKRVRFSENTNEELRQLFAVGAMLFSIILGFLVVVTWQKYESVEQNVVKEASAVEALYHQSGMLAPNDAVAFRSHIALYTSAVINKEWAMMPQHGESQEAKDQLADLWDVAGQLRHGDDGEITISTSVAETLNTITEARRARLYDNEVGLPWFFWTFIIAFSVFIVVMFNLFKNRQLRQRVSVNLILGACIGVSFLFIMLIDYPFAGDTSIKPTAFEQVHDAITQIE